MTADVESPGEKIIFDIGVYDVRKILGARRGDHDITPSTPDLTQGVLGCETAKNVAGADE
jgi:hypothetical protein